MEKETLQNLIFVVQALNNVSVSGKTNLTNLTVSIETLEGIIRKSQQEQSE